MEWTLTGPATPVMTKAQVVAYLNFSSERTLDRLIREGRFPQGIKAGGHDKPVWTGLDVACWLHLFPRCLIGDGTPQENESENDPE